MVYSATTKSANPVQQSTASGLQQCTGELSRAEMDINEEEDMKDVVLWYNQW